MSIAATAAKGSFGSAMTAHQAVASNTPATTIAAKFSDYLKEKQGKPQATATPNGVAPTPDQLAKTLFGSAYDDTAKSVRLDKLAATLQKRTAEFADQLHNTLAGAGIDPNTPLELNVGADGRILVDGNHPKAAEITKLFEESSALAQSYRDIAAQNDHLAMQQVGGAYIKEWDAAKNDGERQASWNRYSTLMDKLSSMFSGRMTFGPSTAVTESQQMLRRMAIV